MARRVPHQEENLDKKTTHTSYMVHILYVIQHSKFLKTDWSIDAATGKCCPKAKGISSSPCPGVTYDFIKLYM